MIYHLHFTLHFLNTLIKRFLSITQCLLGISLDYADQTETSPGFEDVCLLEERIITCKICRFVMFTFHHKHIFTFIIYHDIPREAYLHSLNTTISPGKHIYIHYIPRYPQGSITSLCLYPWGHLDKTTQGRIGEICCALYTWRGGGVCCALYTWRGRVCCALYTWRGVCCALFYLFV